MSTNKVYGDRPNTIALRELETRWDYDDPAYEHGISEDFPIDQSKHSLFGRLQGCRRCHGPGIRSLLRDAHLLPPRRMPHRSEPQRRRTPRLPLLPREVQSRGREYRVFGYKGKQVRDNIHSHDVAAFIGEFIKAPRTGEVYNIGGGRANSCSIWEAFKLAEKFSGKAQVYQYVDETASATTSATSPTFARCAATTLPGTSPSSRGDGAADRQRRGA